MENLNKIFSNLLTTCCGCLGEERRNQVGLAFIKTIDLFRFVSTAYENELLNVSDSNGIKRTGPVPE